MCAEEAYVRLNVSQVVRGICRSSHAAKTDLSTLFGEIGRPDQVEQQVTGSLPFGPAAPDRDQRLSARTRTTGQYGADNQILNARVEARRLHFDEAEYWPGPHSVAAVYFGASMRLSISVNQLTTTSSGTDCRLSSRVLSIKKR